MVKEKQLESIRESLSTLQAIDYSRDRIMTSPKDTMPDRVGQVIDLEHDVVKAIEKYQAEKAVRITQILSLDSSLQKQILIHRYVDYMALQDIADLLGYSYEYICHVHGDALRDFAKKYLNSKR